MRKKKKLIGSAKTVLTGGSKSDIFSWSFFIELASYESYFGGSGDFFRALASELFDLGLLAFRSTNFAEYSMRMRLGVQVADM